MPEPTKRPNIVFIMADQWAACQVGCYGSGVDSTPTLDALARRGTMYTRNYASIPVCGPNRATILTGRSMEIHGVVTNNLHVRPRTPTYAQALLRAGYRTGGFGKFHHGPMQQELPADYSHLGFQETVISEDPKLGPWLDWVRDEHPEHYERAKAVTWPMPQTKEWGPEKKDFQAELVAARRKILGPLIEESGMPFAYPSPLPKELHQTTYITDKALDFMHRATGESPDQPFFCFVSYVDPHDPYDPPAPYDRMFDPADMPAPIPPPPGGHSNPMLEKSRRIWDFHEHSDDVEKMKKLRALFHGSCRLIDDQVKRLLEFLALRGLDRDTIVVFTTDHGEMLGDYGLIAKGIKHYDAGIRCPLIAAGPGIERGKVDDRLTCSLDFFPTFCDWAGIDAPPPLEGKSFVTEPGGWDAVTVQAPYYSGEYSVSSIVTRDGWRLSVYHHEGHGQMFNLADDPREQHDLYDEPAHAARRQELTDRLVRALMQRGYVQQYDNLPRQDGTAMRIGEAWGLEPVCKVFE